MDINRSTPLFVLGGTKCGTTYLYQCLAQHPDICQSEPKEPTFFMLDKEYERGKKFYFRRYFNHYDGQPAVVEARTHNLYLPWVPQRISESFPDAHYVILMRNPVDRAYSDYLHARRHGMEDLPLSRALYRDFCRIRSGKDLSTDRAKREFQETYRRGESRYYRRYLEAGYYARFLERYRAVASADRIHSILFSTLINRPQEVVDRLCEVLGLSSCSLEDTSPVNPGSQPRSYGLQKWLKRAGQTSIAQWIPSPLKRWIVASNLREKDDEKMDPLAELWLYDHFRKHNEHLREQVTFSLPNDWFEAEAPREDSNIDVEAGDLR